MDESIVRDNVARCRERAARVLGLVEPDVVDEDSEQSEPCEHENTTRKRELEYPSIPAASRQAKYKIKRCTDCGEVLKRRKVRRSASR